MTRSVCADCFFKLRELEFALADYQRSCELTGAVDMALCYRLAVVNHSIGIKCYKNVEYKTAESHFTQSITHSSLTAHFYQCRARARYELKDVCMQQLHVHVNSESCDNTVDCNTSSIRLNKGPVHSFPL